MTGTLGLAVQPHSAPPREAEAELWHRLRAGDSDARTELFNLHTDFAQRVATRIFHERNRGDLELFDLSQLALTGLAEAIDRFDPARGIPFRGYAMARVRGAILDGLSHSNEMREQISWRHRLRRERMASLNEGQEEARLNPEQALESLSELVLGLALGFMLEGTALYVEQDTPSQANAYQSAAWRELVDALAAATESLPERERTIIRHHYLDGFSFGQIGDVLELSKGRISQLHRSALLRLSKALRRQGYFHLE